MGAAFEALRSGLELATRRWHWLGPLWLANLVIGLAASLPLALAAFGALGQRTWLGELTDPRWPEAIVGLVGARAAASLVGGPPPPVGPLLGSIGLALLAPLAQALAYAALSGGPVAGYLGHQRRGAARLWRWPFLRLWLVSLPAQLLAVLVPLVALPLLGLPLAGPLAALLLLALLNALVELARVGMVAEGERGARRGLGRAMRWLVTAPGPVLALWLLLALLGLVVVGLGVALSYAPLTGLPLALLGLEELALGLAIWAKGVRLASQARLYRRLADRRAPG